MTKANSNNYESGQKLFCLALALFLGFFALPAPPFLTLAPLLVASVALALWKDTQDSRMVLPTADPKLLLVFCFFAAYIFSVLASQNIAKSISALGLFLPGVILALLVASMSHLGIVKLALVRGVVVCIGSFSSLYLYAFALYPTKNSSEVLAGLGSYALVVPNDIAICVILLPFIPLGYSLEKAKFAKLLYWLAAILFLVTLSISGSRLCLAGTALVVILMMGFKQRQLALAPFIILLFVLAVSAVDLAAQTGLMRKLTHIIEHNGRLSVWYVGLTSWTELPILGVGPGGFWGVYQNAISLQSIPPWMSIDHRVVTWAHSLIVEAIIERGILGLTTLVVICGAMFLVFGGRVIRGQYDFNAAVYISFLIFVLMGALELTFQRNWVVLIFFLYVGLFLAHIVPQLSKTDCGHENERC